MSEPQAPEGAASPPRSTRQKLALVAGGLLLLYAVVGYFVVPSIVESQLVDLIEAQTGTRPTLESVSFDPFDWRLELHGFAMPDPSGEGDAIAFETFAADVAVRKLLVARLALEEVVLVEPEISAVVDEEGALNFLAFVPEPAEPAAEPETEETGEDDGLPVVEVASIRIERGDLRFEDRAQAPAFEVAVSPLDLEMQGFTTRAGGESPYSISIRIGSDTALRWTGTLGLEPVRSQGEIALERFDLRLPWDYLSERLAFEVEGGHLALAARYELDLSEGLQLAIDEASLGIRDVRILDPALSEPVVVVPALDVAGVDVRLDRGALVSVGVREVRLDGARIRSHVTEEGEVHLATLFTPLGTEADADGAGAQVPDGAPAEDNAPASAPTITVDRIALRELDVAIEDRSAARPVALSLSPLDLEVTGYASAPGAELGLRLTTGVGEAGRISIDGPLTLEPLATRLAIELESLALGAYQPYLEDVARLDVPSAALSAKLDVDVRSTGQGTPLAITAAGRVQLDDLLTIDRRLERPFVEWGRLRIEDIDFANAAASGEPADRVRIGEIGLSDALAHVVIGADGASNVDGIFGGGEASAEASVAAGSDAPESEASSSSPAPRIEIAKVTLDGIGADFDDLSQNPHFEISLDQLTGTIEGLSSEELARAKVALAGKVDEVAPVRIDGQINPLSGEAFTDVKIEVDGVSLPSFSPYSGRFVGRTIDRGKLGLDLEYELSARHLKASNKVLLDQFQFGKRVESEEATSLPVGLAVAVMRDASGNIEIPLPIEGDLDDPSFSVLGLLGKALVNVVTRVATSPFAVVAGVVGFSGEDLAQVAFAPGSSRLSEAERSELAALGPILARRPALHLEIRGRADPVADEPGLRREKVEAALRLDAYERMSRRERERFGEAAEVELEPDDRLDGLDRLARERLGQRARDLVPEASLPPRGPERDRAVADAALEALAARVELADSDWRRLARARAAVIQDALISTGEISPERLFLVDVEIGPAAEGTEVTSLLELATD